MNITKKRLHKIKKTKNQSRRYIHKKSNKKNKKNNVSKGRKRAHNLKNKTLKLKHKKSVNSKRNLKKQLGGADDDNDATIKELWTPTSEEDDISISDVDVDVDVDTDDSQDKELWTPSSEDVEEPQDDEQEEDKDIEGGEISNSDEKQKDKEEGEDKEEDKDKEESEDKEEGEEEDKEETDEASKEKEEEVKEILLTNLSKHEKWTLFMNALLKIVCIIETKKGEKVVDDDDDDESKDTEEEKENEEEEKKKEIEIDTEMFAKFKNYYDSENDQRRNDELYTNAKAYFDTMDKYYIDCNTIDFREGYETLEDMKDNDTYDEKSKLLMAIHNQVILDKDNIIEKIIKEKEEKGEKEEEQTQTGGAVKEELKKFLEFKKEMKQAKYEVTQKAFVPKTNVILKLDFSNEKLTDNDTPVNYDIAASYNKNDKKVTDDVGDIMKGIVYSLSEHVKEADKVKKKKEEGKTNDMSDETKED